MRWPTPPTGPDGAAITNIAPGPATTPATASDFHDQRSTTAVLPGLRPSPTRHAVVTFGLGLRSVRVETVTGGPARGMKPPRAGGGLLAARPTGAGHDASEHCRRCSQQSRDVRGGVHRPDVSQR